MRDFALQCYGERAVRVSTVIDGEYNDEGGTNYFVTELTVYDEAGNELPVDRTLPFFAAEGIHAALAYALEAALQEKQEAWVRDAIAAAARAGDYARMQELRAATAFPPTTTLSPLPPLTLDEDEQQDILLEALKEYYRHGSEEYVTWDELPTEGTEFDLRKCPRLSFEITPL